MATPYWSDQKVGDSVEEAKVEEFLVGELEIGPYSRDTNPTVGLYSGSQFYYLLAKNEDLEWMF